jgi:hypothetical protein
MGKHLLALPETQGKTRLTLKAFSRPEIFIPRPDDPQTDVYTVV